jgi:xanthine/uracil permease
MRSAGSVASGILVLTVLSFLFEAGVLRVAGEDIGVTPHAMSSPVRAVVALLTLLSVVAGGYVTAAFAGRKPVAHAVAMGLVLLAMTAVVMTSTGVEGPTWIAITSVCLLVPAAWAGGRLRVGTGRRPEEETGVSRV